jgi:hypothetical protein
VIADVARTAEQALVRLQGGSTAEKWAACAVIWARLWVLAARGWQRWPKAADRIRDALNLALLQAVELPDNSDRQALLSSSRL